MSTEALKLALEALERYTWAEGIPWQQTEEAIDAIKAALAAPVQEPDELTIAYMSGLYDGKKHAAQRQWVGLTVEEIEECWDGYLSDYQLQMIREMETKLKEKNT